MLHYAGPLNAVRSALWTVLTQAITQTAAESGNTKAYIGAGLQPYTGSGGPRCLANAHSLSVQSKCNVVEVTNASGGRLKCGDD